MRQLLINGRFLSQRTAVTMVARQLTLALAAAPGDWQITLVVPPSLDQAAQRLGVPVRVHGRLRGAAWDQIDLPALRHEGVIAGFFNTVPLRGRGYVTLLHDAHVFTTPASYPRMTGAWRRILSRRAGAPGNHVLTVSDHARGQLMAQGIGAGGQIAVVPNGPGDVVRVPVGALPGGLHGPYCLGFSSLLPHKNLQVLLRAFADPRLSGVTLALVGAAGPEALRRAGLHLPPNVRCLGMVGDETLAALYAGARAVCVPSIAEGFGLPVLEAMCLGAVPVTSGCGALREVAGTAGLVASARDPAAWVAAIGRLEDDGLRAGLVDLGRRRAAQFTWAAAARQVLAQLDRWYPQPAKSPGDRMRQRSDSQTATAPSTPAPASPRPSRRGVATPASTCQPDQSAAP